LSEVSAQKIMIIVLHGKDSFRSDKKLKDIITEYKKKNKSGINITHLPEKSSFNDLKDSSRQLGMFEEKRLLIGKDLLQNKDLKKEVGKRLDELIQGDNILILKETEKIKGKLVDELEKMDNSSVMVQEFEKLKGRKLKSWYKRELSKYDTQPERGVVSKMIEYIGNDLWRASNEISKLANMKAGKRIKREDVIKYVRPELNTDIFKTIDSLSDGDMSKAVQLVEDHIRKGDSPFYLLSMINYQVRNLLTIKQLKEEGFTQKEVRKRSGMSPFVFKKTNSQVNGFSFSQIKKIHQTSFKVDLDSKLGKITPETGLIIVISQF